MLSQSTYLFSAKVFSYGLRILLPIFLVRVFNKTDFGYYAQFFLIETLLKNLFAMGIAQALYYFVPRDPRNAGGYFLNTLLTSLTFFVVGYGVVGLFRVPLAEETGLVVLATFFFYLLPYSLVMMGNGAAETYLTARKYFGQAAVFEIMRQTLATAATLIVAWLTRDLRHVMLALILARAFSLVVVLVYIHFAQHGFRSERYFFNITTQIRYGVVLGLAGLLWTLLSRFHELAVSRYYDVETYAVYAAGLRQIPVLQLFAQSVASVALVRFAQLEKESDWAGIRAFWDRILGSMYGVAIPLTVVMLLVAKPLVILMFTADYADAVPIFRWNTIAMLYIVLNPTLVLRAMDRNDITLKVHAGLVMVLPLALYAGMKAFGIVGLIAVHAVALNLGRIVTQVTLNRMAGTNLPFVASRASIREFYRDTWQAARRKLAALRPA